jgi:hypothetical protein
MTEWDYICVHCGTVNPDPLDALERYCAACHQWADDYTSSLSYHWILDEMHRPVRAPLSVWGPWFEQLENRQVAETFTQTTRIATSFLGLNHQSTTSPPLLFETMAVARDDRRSPLIDYLVHDDLCLRDTTWDDAVTTHNTLVRRMLNREMRALAALARSKKQIDP